MESDRWPGIAPGKHFWHGLHRSLPLIQGDLHWPWPFSLAISFINCLWSVHLWYRKNMATIRIFPALGLFIGDIVLELPLDSAVSSMDRYARYSRERWAIVWHVPLLFPQSLKSLQYPLTVPGSFLSVDPIEIGIWLRAVRKPLVSTKYFKKQRNFDGLRVSRATRIPISATRVRLSSQRAAWCGRWRFSPHESLDDYLFMKNHGLLKCDVFLLGVSFFQNIDGAFHFPFMGGPGRSAY